MPSTARLSGVSPAASTASGCARAVHAAARGVAAAHACRAHSSADALAVRSACGPAGSGISASEFEEHSGSKDRRPADGIYLDDCNRTLKDVLALVK